MNFARQILEGLTTLHNENFVHFDLKLQNILVDETLDKLKICDFGLSKIMKD